MSNTSPSTLSRKQIHDRILRYISNNPGVQPISIIKALPGAGESFSLDLPQLLTELVNGGLLTEVIYEPKQYYTGSLYYAKGKELSLIKDDKNVILSYNNKVSHRFPLGTVVNIYSRNSHVQV